MIRNLFLILVIVLLTGIAYSSEDAARGGRPNASPPRTEAQVIPTGVARVVATFDSPVLRPAGLGWDGVSLWLMSDQDQTIYKLDPATMAVLDTLPAPTANWTFGLDHDGTDLWGDTDEPEVIFQMDDSSGGVLSSFVSPYSAPNGVVFDGAKVWHSAFSQDLALMDPATGLVSRTIPAPGNGAPRGLEMFGGSLWVVDANGYVDDAIHRLDPANGTIQATYLPVGAPIELIYGLAHDGSRFWLSDLDTAKIHILEMEDDLVFADGFESGDGVMWSFTGLACGSTPVAPGAGCPPECTGGCPVAGYCVIDCSGTSACVGSYIECPAGFDCNVQCIGDQSCRYSVIACPEDQICDVDCIGSQACELTEMECSWLGACELSCGSEADACASTQLGCGHNSCLASCAGASHPLVECGGSCDCVTCD